MSDIIQAFPKGTGSGGGHTILDTNGTAVTQEKNLQFIGLSVIDDSTNEKTEVAGEGLNAESINDIAEANSTVPAVIIGDANNYSTSEKIIGKWIDGKPIYQKTYKFNTVSTSNSLGMTINPENVINFFGTVVNSENQCQALNCQHPSYQDRYGVLTYLTSTAIEMRSINGYEWALSNLRSLKITLQYTKTTDA